MSVERVGKSKFDELIDAPRLRPPWGNSLDILRRPGINPPGIRPFDLP